MVSAHILPSSLLRFQAKRHSSTSAGGLRSLLESAVHEVGSGVPQLPRQRIGGQLPTLGGGRGRSQ
eukprot:7430250-Pyramimonas_sp.AAC.1